MHYMRRIWRIRLYWNNYEKMQENVAKLSNDDNVTSSTNILKFIENFENDDESWIDEINKKL